MSNVVLSNKLPQVLTITVLDAGGAPVELKLQPNGTSDPIDRARLTPHVDQLAAAGHIRVRPVV